MKSSVYLQYFPKDFSQKNQLIINDFKLLHTWNKNISRRPWINNKFKFLIANKSI